MKKRYLLVIFIMLLTPICAASAASWQQITTTQGTSAQTTSYFTVPTTEWRIRWTYTPTSEYGGTLGVFVYEKNGDYVSAFSSGSDLNGITYIHEGKTEYYLEILPAFANYEITVEYDNSASSQPPTTITPQNSVSMSDALNITIIALFAAAIIMVLLYAARRGRKNKPLSPKTATALLHGNDR